MYKIIHLEKDNQIDHMECHECGRSIKHAIQIGTTLYGMDCGAKKLGWPAHIIASKSKLNRHAAKVEGYMVCYKHTFKCLSTNNPHTLAKAYVEAGALCELLNLEYKRTDDMFLWKVYKAIK